VSPGELSELPAGVKGLVWLGMTGGVTAAFEAAVDACIGSRNLYGFYLVDEPDASAPTAANLMAEADYIHAHVPGAETFMMEQNLSSNTSQVFYYMPANTHIDLFGLDPYPVNTNVPNNLDYNIIPLAVSTAEADGIKQQAIVPVYQAFGGGGYSTYILPTAVQEQQILSTWGSLTPIGPSIMPIAGGRRRATRRSAMTRHCRPSSPHTMQVRRLRLQPCRSRIQPCRSQKEAEQSIWASA
jgi:hypothetical protein